MSYLLLLLLTVNVYCVHKRLLVTTRNWISWKLFCWIFSGLKKFLFSSVKITCSLNKQAIFFTKCKRFKEDLMVTHPSTVRGRRCLMFTCNREDRGFESQWEGKFFFSFFPFPFILTATLRTKYAIKIIQFLF